MTTEEAIKELSLHLVHWKRLKNEHIVPTDECDNTINALRMAIEVLSELSGDLSTDAARSIENANQNSNGDLIYREDALEQIAQAVCGLHYDDCEADNCSCSYIQRILDISSADTEMLNINKLVDRIKAIIEENKILKESADKLSGEWIQKPHKVYLARDYEPDITDYHNRQYNEEDHSIVEYWWHCNQCDYEADRWFKPTFKFCPNCGAEIIRNEKKKENNNVHKMPLYAYASWDRSEE